MLFMRGQNDAALRTQQVKVGHRMHFLEMLLQLGNCLNLGAADGAALGQVFLVLLRHVASQGQTVIRAELAMAAPQEV